MRRHRSLSRTALAATTLAFFAPFVFASTSAADAPQDQAVVVDTAQADTETEIAASDEYSPIRQRQCMQKTGSLITAVRNRRAEREGKPLECAPAFGRTYTYEDLRNTGGTDLGEILRSLDPSIR